MMARLDGLADPVPRYVELITAASAQIADLLDQLGLVARIEADRWEPALRSVDSLELARAAAGTVVSGTVTVEGTGAAVLVEPEPASRSLASLLGAALRHGGLQRAELRVSAGAFVLSPVAPELAPVLTGQDLRDLGSTVAVRVVAALGGSVAVEAEALRVSLPLADPSRAIS